MPQTNRLGAPSALIAAVTCTAGLLTQNAFAATTGWDQATPNTYSYLDTTKWVGGTINDRFDGSLSLTDNGTTGNQVLTFDTDHSTPGAMDFLYTDANTPSVPYNFTLRSDGVANRTLTLGGTLTFSPVRTTRQLVIGSATANENLNLNLGGARTINVTTAGGSSDVRSDGISVQNVISNGSITKTGGGWLRIGGGVANTFSGLTVSGGVVRLEKTVADAVTGDVLVNGGTLLVATNDQISNSSNVTLSSGGLYFAGTSASTSGGGSPASPSSDTYASLTISGGTFNSCPRTTGAATNGNHTITGAMTVSGTAAITLRNNSTFSVKSLSVTGSTINLSSAGSGISGTRTNFNIGADGATITNLATNTAYTPISAGNWTRIALAGDLTFNGNGTNTNAVTIAAAANLAGGANDLRGFSLDGGIRTFTINDGAADVDLLLDGDWQIVNTRTTGTGGITKAGNGTLQIDSTGTYTGATTVNAGRLLVNGTIASAATVNAGKLGGTGNIAGGITLNNGATLAPGASIESLASGNNVWNTGGNFELELSTDGSTGAAGTEWDLLAITGTLDLTNVGTNGMAMKLFTMANASTAGTLGTFDPLQNHSWAGFVTTTGGITGFAGNKFAMNTAGFQNTFGGTFSVVQNTSNPNNLDLVYSVPEPASLSLLALGGLALRRRRR